MEKKSTSKKATPKKSMKKKVTVPTLLQAIENVVELSRDSRMSDDFWLKAAPELAFLAESYGITERQALFFCICMQRGPRRVDFDDLASHLDISKIRILSYASDISALVHRRLLRFRDVKEEDDIDVPAAVIKCLKHNEVYQLPKRTDLDCAGLFNVLNEWFDDLDDDAVSVPELKSEIEQLFEENKQIGFVRQIKEQSLCGDYKLLLVLFCHLLINKDDDDIRFNQIESVFESAPRFHRERAMLRSGDHLLMSKNLIEHRCEDGIADTNRYRLTDHAKRTLLAEMNINTAGPNLADVLKAKNLKPKELFYSPDNEKQVEELASFFDEKQFRQIHDRMQERGFRNGFACLFYGGPGTGKTETVYQLARKTGRDIMVVDVPQIKSKWVGDSEKNIKALFDRYRELVRKSEIAPILLFNEADAIIGIRKQGAQNAVDKMENTVQNIILQEMETLDGIMIATTNLADNLDSAFERRFLYKIKFDKPDAGVRQKIWQIMIPELTDADSKVLSEQFEFSGGQIENIARKHTINTILYGHDADLLQHLRSHCENERLSSKNVFRRIGF